MWFSLVEEYRQDWGGQRSETCGKDAWLGQVTEMLRLVLRHEDRSVMQRRTRRVAYLERGNYRTLRQIGEAGEEEGGIW